MNAEVRSKNAELESGVAGGDETIGFPSAFCLLTSDFNEDEAPVIGKNRELATKN